MFSLCLLFLIGSQVHPIYTAIFLPQKKWSSQAIRKANGTEWQQRFSGWWRQQPSFYMGFLHGINVNTYFLGGDEHP
jgi:hypothetical protein